jgi:hypothetical protein
MASVTAPQLAHDSPADALSYLRYHWADAFDIRRSVNRWTARRRDTGKLLVTTDPDALLSLMRSEPPVDR